MEIKHHHSIFNYLLTLKLIVEKTYLLLIKYHQNLKLLIYF